MISDGPLTDARVWLAILDSVTRSGAFRDEIASTDAFFVGFRERFPQAHQGRGLFMTEPDESADLGPLAKGVKGATGPTGATGPSYARGATGAVFDSARPFGEAKDFYKPTPKAGDGEDEFENDRKHPGPTGATGPQGRIKPRGWPWAKRDYE